MAVIITFPTATIDTLRPVTKAIVGSLEANVKAPVEFVVGKFKLKSASPYVFVEIEKLVSVGVDTEVVNKAVIDAAE